MNNNEKCSDCISLNEDCNALTFCCLIGKTPLQYCSDPWKQCSKQIISIYESLILKLPKN